MRDPVLEIHGGAREMQSRRLVAEEHEPERPSLHYRPLLVQPVRVDRPHAKHDRACFGHLCERRRIDEDRSLRSLPDEVTHQITQPLGPRSIDEHDHAAPREAQDEAQPVEPGVRSRCSVRSGCG